MERDNYKDYKNSRDRLVAGINKVYEVIKPTYGPAGSNVAMEVELYPGHGVYNDGKKIADSIFLEDPVEQMGANILKEACDKQEKECGDGRKTTIILTAAILNEGLKITDKKPLEIKKELDTALTKALQSIDEQKKEIALEDIGKIAKIASESEEIGNLIGEIYPKIGRDGIIEVESSQIPNTSYEIVDGIRLHGAKKLLDIVPYQEVSVVENARVLIVKDKIQSKSQIETVYKKLKGVTNTVVLYCDEIEQAVLGSLARSNIAALQGEEYMRTLVVKAPVMFKDWLYEDLEKMTGAIALDSSKGITWASWKPEYLGTVKSWKAGKDETLLNGTLDITDHVAAIKANPDMTVRANWLNTKVANLKVGANSESELSWKIKKTIDAANASRLALKEGVVTGAGLSLGTASIQVHDDKIMFNALNKPSKVLEENGEVKVVIGETLDPAVVIKSALTTAVSLAGMILTLSGVLVVPEFYKEMARKAQQQIPR